MLDRVMNVLGALIEALGRAGPTDPAELGLYQRIESRPIPPRDEDRIDVMDRWT